MFSPILSFEGFSVYYRTFWYQDGTNLAQGKGSVVKADPFLLNNINIDNHQPNELEINQER